MESELWRESCGERDVDREVLRELWRERCGERCGKRVVERGVERGVKKEVRRERCGERDVEREVWREVLRERCGDRGVEANETILAISHQFWAILDYLKTKSWLSPADTSSHRYSLLVSGERCGDVWRERCGERC